VILENLSFSSLVEPFEKNGVSGKTIDRMSSHRTIVDIGKGQINEVVAQTFYEDYLLEWKQAGGIPRDLLQQTLVPTSSLKVMCSEDTQIIMHGKFICIYVGQHDLVARDQKISIGESTLLLISY
jgi:hypothetical protein